MGMGWLYGEVRHKQLGLNCVLKPSEDSRWEPKGKATIYGLKLSRRTVHSISTSLWLLNLCAGTNTEQK